jgi:hypothetical protein
MTANGAKEKRGVGRILRSEEEKERGRVKVINANRKTKRKGK